ncbi:Endoribonuclease LACTB2 [Nymphon striatum]|nr:Endoribonuclease LACTB2 [Nymphon striatum]
MSTLIPAVSSLAPNIVRILGCNPGTYDITRRILLDTGEHNKPKFIKNLKDTLEDLGVTLQSIIITHWHHDHVGGLDEIFNNVSVDVNCKVHKLKPESGQEKSSFSTEVSEKLSYISDGEFLKTDGATLRAIHTPGHTNDHLVVMLEEGNSLFSGDCILGEGTAVFEDLHSYMKSLHKILDLKPDVIYPGHGPEVHEPMKKIHEYISHRLHREKQIMDVLLSHKGRSFTPKELTKIIYKDVPENLHVAAAGNVTHHLSKLVKEEVIGEFRMLRIFLCCKKQYVEYIQPFENGS